MQLYFTACATIIAMNTGVLRSTRETRSAVDAFSCRRARCERGHRRRAGAGN
jgi:hypothetical protein